jgi:uncharacterized DUF497 family protein
MSERQIKPFRWNDQKNSQLQEDRGVGFENVVLAITAGKLLDTIEHPNQEKYPSQKIFIIEINQYIYLVPFVENDQEIFLKTIIPSRKMKKQYLGE